METTTMTKLEAAKRRMARRAAAAALLGLEAGRYMELRARLRKGSQNAFPDPPAVKAALRGAMARIRDSLPAEQAEALAQLIADEREDFAPMMPPVSCIVEIRQRERSFS